MVKELCMLMGCSSAFYCGYVATPLFRAFYKRVITAMYLQNHSDAPRNTSRLSVKEILEGFTQYFVRNGVQWSMPCAQRLLRNSWVRRQCRKAVQLAHMRGLTSKTESIASVFVALYGVTFVVSLIAMQSVLVGVVSVGLMAWVSQLVIAKEETRREALLRKQVPDAMRSLCACFQAGYSLPQAFMQTSKESKSPTKELLVRVAQDIEIGKPVHEALWTLKNASDIPELGFVAVALDIQHISGGSVVPVLESAEESVRRSLEMRRFMRAQTAQARFSAQLVSGMPIVMLALLTFISPDFLAPLYRSATGIAMAIVATGLLIVGIGWVRHLLAMEVD